jgi:hypothetical protein
MKMKLRVIAIAATKNSWYVGSALFFSGIGSIIDVFMVHRCGMIYYLLTLK